MVPFLSNKRQCTIALTVVVLIMLAGLLPFPNQALAQSEVALDPSGGLPGTKITAQAEYTITGDWELDYEAYRYLRSDGSTVDEIVHNTIVAQFSAVENGFTGSYITSGDSCGEVEINGTTQDNQVNWVTRFTGSCCQGYD